MTAKIKYITYSDQKWLYYVSRGIKSIEMVGNENYLAHFVKLSTSERLFVFCFVKLKFHGEIHVYFI